jgi:hypothetical protein
MSTWNERLSEVMTERGVSIADVSHATGAAHTSVMAWIGAGSVKPTSDLRASHLLRACELLSVRPEWIIFGTGSRQMVEEWPFTTPRSSIDRLDPEGRRMIDRILFTLVEFLAGHTKV